MHVPIIYINNFPPKVRQLCFIELSHAAGMVMFFKHINGN